MTLVLCPFSVPGNTESWDSVARELDIDAEDRNLQRCKQVADAC